MRSHKSPKIKPHSFTDEQIRAKAYEHWQKHPERTEAENWETAIKALRRQRLLQPFTSFWYWTGFGQKKGWDFLQLLVAPAVIALIGFGLNQYVKEKDAKQQILDKAKEQAAAENKAQQDRQLADDKAGFLDAKVRKAT